MYKWIRYDHQYHFQIHHSIHILVQIHHTLYSIHNHYFSMFSKEYHFQYPSYFDEPIYWWISCLVDEWNENNENDSTIHHSFMIWINHFHSILVERLSIWIYSISIYLLIPSIRRCILCSVLTCYTMIE